MKTRLIFIFLLLGGFYLQAQVEISPYLDKNGVTNGINYAATTVNGVTVSGVDSLFTYYGAIEACRNLVYDGKTDWYLPSFEEIVLFLPQPPASGFLDDNTLQWAGCTTPSKASKGGGTSASNVNNDKGCYISPIFTWRTTPTKVLDRTSPTETNFYANQAIRSVGSVYRGGMVPYIKPLAFYTAIPSADWYPDLTLVGFAEQSAPAFTVQCVR